MHRSRPRQPQPRSRPTPRHVRGGAAGRWEATTYTAVGSDQTGSDSDRHSPAVGAPRGRTSQETTAPRQAKRAHSTRRSVSSTEVRAFGSSTLSAEAVTSLLWRPAEDAVPRWPRCHGLSPRAGQGAAIDTPDGCDSFSGRSGPRLADRRLLPRCGDKEPFKILIACADPLHHGRGRCWKSADGGPR